MPYHWPQKPVATNIDVATVRMGRFQAWARVCRPLLLWFVAFIALWGYTLHHHFLRQTRLAAAVSFQGKRIGYEAEIFLDGSPHRFGELVSLGRHQLTVRNPKAVTFQTNLFVWYGRRELGEIVLKRAKGILSVSAVPIAERLTIRGPEFSIVLTNSAGFTSSVPTDRYVVEASYKYWKEIEGVTVSTDATANHKIAPRLGTLTVGASHADISYELRKSDRTLMESGTLPVTIAGLSESSGYQLLSERKTDQQSQIVAVNGGTTNTVKVEFVYGTAIIESEPAGATVLRNGREIGTTPLTLPEVNLGSFEFTLHLAEFETVSGTLTIAANETNSFHTNLISRYFTLAMASARQYYANADYDRALKAATEALKHKAGDAEATGLQREAKTMGHLVRAEALALRGDFTNAISEANLALTTTPDSKQAKELLADYTNREQQRIEAVRKREAELAEQERQRRERERIEQLAQQRIRELHDGFAAANRPYENASLFSSYELIATNDVRKVGNAINSALTSKQPAFGNLKMNWLYPHIFMIEARQTIGIGYRACLILGTQVRENEVRIQFKVFEYEHPPDLKLLGGLFQLSTAINVTSQDPNVEAQKAERFRQRVKEGIELLKGRIQGAASP